MLVAKVRNINHYSPYQGGPKIAAYWVKYIVVRDGVFEHEGERLIRAVDELEVFRKFPAEIIERHGVDSVEWLCEVNNG